MPKIISTGIQSKTSDPIQLQYLMFTSLIVIPGILSHSHAVHLSHIAYSKLAILE